MAGVKNFWIQARFKVKPKINSYEITGMDSKGLAHAYESL